MLIERLSLDTNMVSLGALLGTQGHTEILRRMNASQSGGSFFGSGNDPFAHRFQEFMNKVVEPIRTVEHKLGETARALFTREESRPIICEEDLRDGIPPAMRLGIVHYEPIRRLVDAGRSDGFGIDPSTLQPEDPFAEECADGVVDLDPALISDDGLFTVDCTICGNDPLLSDEAAMDLIETRMFIDNFINSNDTKHIDFCSYPDLLG